MRPSLPDVTLLAVTGVAVDATARALSASLDQADFARALLLSHRSPTARNDPRIEWRGIEPLRSKADYSAFMLHRLHEHVSTSHALCVQWDGFVLDGSAWQPKFLEYDYIGAVWPQFSDGHNVGNGGFSLRSRRLMLATKDFEYDGANPEDVVIARSCRQQLEDRGFRFAPEAVARAFAFERTAPTSREFGFHGAFNLVELRDKEDLFALFKSLEPQLLNPNEHNELLRWAVRKRYLYLAMLVVLRLLRQQLLQR